MCSTLTLALLLLVHLRLSVGVSDGPLHTVGHGSEEKLFGWQGESYRPTWKIRPEMIHQISWKPRAYIYRNFISDIEAQHVADVASRSMKRSTVVGENGSSVVDDYRTSYGTFINRRKDPVITAIEERAALWTKVPAWFQEDMQVLRYGHGQYYHRHMDSLEDDTPRLATMLVYLSTPTLGGETAFPQSEWIDPAMKTKFGPFSECVKDNVGFKPRRGDALLFWSVGLDGKTQDLNSEHEGCPVVTGVKWTATIWTHTAPYRYESWQASLNQSAADMAAEDEEDDPGFCVNQDGRCDHWAEGGECQKNPVYMKTNCRASCKACEVCPKDEDRTARDSCYNRNRDKLGYLVYDQGELARSDIGRVEEGEEL